MHVSHANQALLQRPVIALIAHGGLVLPAQGVVDVNLFVESYLRQISDIHKVSHQVNSANVQLAVVQEFKEKDIFHLEDHIHETQDCDNNHHIDMIELVCQTYYDLRQHHICRLHNSSLYSKQLQKPYFSWGSN